MRIIVPYTKLSWPTVEALDAAHPDTWEAHYVGGDDEAYWRLLLSLWERAEDFAIVEQDIVVNLDTLANFEGCPAPWCHAPYPYLRGERYAGLGCVRFRASLMRDHPDALELAGEYHDAKHPKRFWCSLDAALCARTLRARGLQPCLRHATVGHLHRIPSHGCVPAEYLPVEDAA